MDARSAYRLLAGSYDQQPNALVSLEQRTMASLFPDVRGKTVVDAAAGTGRWARYCVMGGARVVSLDFCLQLLQHAPHSSLVADLNCLPLADACADLTICAFALGYAPRAFKELHRVTRSGGTVLVSDMHPNAIRGGWTRSFRRGSEVIEVAHQPYSLDELRHPGLKLECLIEPGFGAPEREIFECSGHAARFDDAAKGPAIFVARWAKR